MRTEIRLNEPELRKWAVEHREEIGLITEDIALMSAFTLQRHIKQTHIFLQNIYKDTTGTNNVYIFKKNDSHMEEHRLYGMEGK